ncbi:MAG: WD40 repeat domain-containing protein [Burkholderiales bacterium]|nr:WD40 repeat domain-containing protein [Burkholderiales bacterium]MDE2397013.1 WD40 repeat domain-containing protein [Burkholderiales bacterium]MDE2453486.1 WD40 repeat domain-containing protein [Burkholderiales bacterium]
MSAPELIELLGARWPGAAPVVGLAWDAAGETVAYALGDGSLQLVDTRWRRGPRLERHPRGAGLAVIQAEAEAPAPRRAQPHPVTCLCIAAQSAGGFLSGGDDGRVVQTGAGGDTEVLALVGEHWITAVACGRDGRRAWASRRRIERIVDGRAAALELPAAATALAFSPDGACLAAAHSGGVTLWPDEGEARPLVWRGYHRALAWSPDGRYLVSAMQENALHGWRIADGGDIEMGGYPGQPLSLAFAGDGSYLATSGGQRAVCWRFDPPDERPPFECGPAAKTPVTAVACHPRQSLIAVGAHNGALMLAQPGSEQALFVKGAGGGALNAIAWSAHGERLAYGTQDGEIGWLSLPDVLFNRRASAPQPSSETTT